MKWPWPFSRLRVAPRVAIALVLAILIAGVLERGLRDILPPSPELVVQRSWLSDAMEEAAQTVIATPPADRAAALSRLKSSKTLRYDVLPSIPDDATIGPFRYGTQSPQVILMGRHQGDDPLQDALSARTLRDLQIAVQLPDGNWLVVREKAPADMVSRYALYLSGLVGRILLIILFSYAMAWMILRPLSRLSAAAERMGRAREPTLITGMNAPEYAAIAETFNEMQMRLKHHADGRTQMLAAISHDLRTPLTRLRLLAEYVPDAQRERMLADIGDMEAMLSDTLAFAGAEMRREREQVIDLAALLISLTDTFSDTGETVQYDGPDHLTITCRPVAIKRAFTNLIANGCQYGEAVQIRLSAASNVAIVDIVDRGPGIPPEEAERAFEPFERLEASRSRESGGTGLGLTIAREAVIGQGGGIVFIHDPEGFTVRVTLALYR